MSTRDAVEKAQFTPKTGPNQKPFFAHFNPVSLQYSVTNTLKEEDKGGIKKQYITQSSAKLTMDLIFDNTADGQDVRLSTVKIAALMQPDPKSSGSKQQAAPTVLFEWGTFKFQGMMESYKETLDFFAPKGVPLRASVNITLVEQKFIFATGQANTAGDLSADAVSVPNGAGSNPSSVASAGGDPSAARALAALNGQASLRFSAGASLTVSGSVTLAPPAAFASAGAGLGISAGAGAGIGFGAGAGASAGVGASAGAGFSAGAGAGFSAGAGAGVGISAGAGGGISAGAGLSANASTGISSGASFDFSPAGGAQVGISGGGALFGSSASAGVAASRGAFAGLRVATPQPTATLDTARFLQVSESVSVSTDAGTGFAAGGRAISSGSAGLSADVGADVDLRARIQFEVE